MTPSADAGPDGAFDAPFDGGDAAPDAGPKRTGAFKWLFQVPKLSNFVMGVGPDGSTSVASTFGGDLQMNGQTINAHAGGTDLMVFQLDPAGKLKWFKSFGLDSVDFHVSGLSVSGNAVVIAGWIESQDSNVLVWKPTPFHPITVANSGSMGPYVLAVDASQGGVPMWARSVVGKTGEGLCASVSANSAAGMLAVGCDVQSGGISVPTSTGNYDVTTGSAVVETIRVSDGLANGILSTDVALDPDGLVYASATATAAPLKLRRANASIPFDGKPSNVVLAMQAGGGAKWSRFWARGVSDEGSARLAIDSKKNPWVGLSFTGSTNPGGGVLTSQGQSDWSVIHLSPTDGSVVGQAAFGGSSQDGMFRVAFDRDDLVLFGDGKGFPIGSLAVPSSVGQSTKLSLAKLDQGSLTQGVWLSSATETDRVLRPQDVGLGVGGDMDIVGASTTTQVELTPTNVVNGTSTGPVLFVAAFDR